MTRWISLTTAAVTTALVLAVAGCADDDNPGNVNSTTSADPLPEESASNTSVPATPVSEPTQSESASTSGSASTAAGANDFTMRTEDGSVDLTGPVSTCENPDETTLRTEFTAGGSTVEVDIRRGTGAVAVAGAASYDGRVTSIQVGDVGNVMIAGKGGGTTFTVTGTCP